MKTPIQRACGATYIGGYSTVLDCTRPLGHRGDHRSFGGSEWDAPASADSGTAAGPVGSGEEARASDHESRTAGRQLESEHQPSSPARQQLSADSSNGDNRG